MTIADKAARFVAAYRATLTASSAANPVLERFIGALDRIDTGRAQSRAGHGASHPALQHLERALADIRCEPALAAAVRDVVPHLSWGSSYSANGPGASVSETMVWGEVAGRAGMVTDPAVRLGCFLLSPGMVYPMHGHEALEIYYVVSGGMTFEHRLDDTVGMTVEAPGYSVTPEGEAHALHAGARPVLIVYCWTGNLDAPVWWWERNAAGGWTKTFPFIDRK